MIRPPSFSAVEQPALRKLWVAARDRLERAGAAHLGSVTVELDTEEGAAVAGLFASRRTFTGRRRIDLGKLDRRLRSSSLGVGLVEVLEHIGGPLRDRRAEREETEKAWRHVWASAASHPVVEKHQALTPWLDSRRKTGWLRRLGGDERTLLAALDVLEALPADGLMLATLAAKSAGHPHALDPGRPVGTLVMSALAQMSDRSFPTTSVQRRQLWDEFGVVCDTLSATVLGLNLRPDSPGFVSDAIRASAQEGEPLSLTLSQLRRERLRFPRDHAPVLACENPSVMDEAKARLGSRSGPVVCVAGRHNTAAALLLTSLVEARVEVRCHGDFDWGGIRIANELVARFGVQPWRLSTADYRAALPAVNPSPLEGRPVAALWDGELSTAMQQTEVAVHEESVIDVLLADLLNAGKSGSDRYPRRGRRSPSRGP